jgi:CHAP domain
MRRFTLTTPPMKGDDVEAAQARLAENKYGRFYWGDQDGEFGPRTNEACLRAKYWLGYPDAGNNRYTAGGYGEFLDAFLGGAKLDAELAQRRKDRIAQVKKLRAAALALAKAEAKKGIREDPFGSNNVLYSRWYMRNPNGWQARDEGPRWCAMFVTWCYVNAGSSVFKRHPDERWAFCPFVVRDAERGDRGLLLTRNPQPGSIVVYKRGEKDWCHIGICEKWLDRAAGKFSAIEGNTSKSNNNNGGAVMRRDDRSLRDNVVFAHVIR